MRSFLVVSVLIMSTVLLSVGDQFHMLMVGIIDLNNLDNYANQRIPRYINRDLTPEDNEINDAEATLGRVLFYDVSLSLDHSTSCASCHQQEFAFSDPDQLSTGRTGDLTGRHSMRLVNARFGREPKFFWDERASSLEDQTTQPIQDHVEMGFSGEEDSPSIDSLFTRLASMDRYQKLFQFAYGDQEVNENRLQRALAQFIRSIQSFDSRYDIGKQIQPNDMLTFPNFTPLENRGKELYMMTVNQGGAGCQECHVAPEFSIDPNSRNNGVISVAGDPDAQDLTNTRSPSIRDLVNPNGRLNGPMMHSGDFTSLEMVINHYNRIPSANPDIDNRLLMGADRRPQNLRLSDNDKEALVAFLRTLSGFGIYSNPIWSDPFDEDGNIMVIMPCEDVDTTIIVELCNGENYNGPLNEVLMASTGCDSVVTYQAIELPVTEDIYTTQECCEGDCNGYESGSYALPLIDDNGCGYSEILEVVVYPIQEEHTVEECCFDTCNGEPGVYISEVIDSNGCNKLVVYELIELPQVQTRIDTAICANEVYMGIEDEGFYNFEYVAANGCDSIVTINLMHLPESECMSSTDDNLIEASSIAIGPNPFNNKLTVTAPDIKEGKYNLYSISGELVHQDYFSETISLDGTALHKGLYILEITDLATNKYLREKVIKI